MKAVINFGLVFLITISLMSCEKEMSISPEGDQIYYGKILIDSDPQGGKIFVNGDNTGKFTPDSIVHLEPGNYTIKIKLYPYLDIIDSLILEDYSTKEYSANFFGDTRNFGSITVNSNPSGAMIYLRDSCLDLTTPATIDKLWPGLYSISCTYPVHRRKNTYVLVRGGESKSTSLTLQDTSVFVDYFPSNSDFAYIRTICVEVDKHYNKWVGLPGAGIIKFTETSVTEYNTTNSQLPNDYVNCIAIDNSDRIWIGTSHGLVIIDNGNWTVYTLDNSEIPHDAITSIAFDSQGNAWLGASDPRTAQLLVKFDGTNWYSYPAGALVISLAVDNDDRVWVGLNQGLVLFENEEWVNILNTENSTQLLRERTAESIAKDIDGRMWICSGTEMKGPYYSPGALFVYENNTFREINVPERIISHIKILDDGTKWVSCFGKYPIENLANDRTRLFKIDMNENITKFSKEDNLPGDLIRYVSIDPNGDLWLASRDRGIIKFKTANL